MAVADTGSPWSWKEKSDGVDLADRADRSRSAWFLVREMRFCRISRTLKWQLNNGVRSRKNGQGFRRGKDY